LQLKAAAVASTEKGIKRIAYCTWEGDAALLVHYKDGRIYDFTKYGQNWTEGHDADIATKAALLTKDQFDAMFGSLVGANGSIQAARPCARIILWAKEEMRFGALPHKARSGSLSRRTAQGAAARSCSASLTTRRGVLSARCRMPVF
jgi:hypothetical protein